MDGGRQRKGGGERDTKINSIILILQGSPSYGWTAGNTSELNQNW